MPSICEKLRLLGAKVGFRFNGIFVLTDSGKFFCQFGTDLNAISLETEMGNDPREADQAHFLRPAPNLSVNEVITEADRPENKWLVTSSREEHPYKPTVYYKVTKIVDGLDT